MTKKLLEASEDGLIDKDKVIAAFCSYMSEESVADLCKRNAFFEGEEEE